MVKRKKSEKEKMRIKCLDLAKKIAKERDGYICQKCGKYVKGFNCHASHVIPVSSSRALEHDTKNLKALCYYCHIRWWHKNPLEATAWFKKKFPSRYKYLQKKRKEPPKPLTLPYYQKTYKKLLKEYDNLETHSDS